MEGKKQSAQRKWDQENTTCIKMKLANKRDAAIIAWWKSLPPSEKTNTFRRLALAEIEKLKREEEKS